MVCYNGAVAGPVGSRKTEADTWGDRRRCGTGGGDGEFDRNVIAADRRQESDCGTAGEIGGEKDYVGCGVADGAGGARQMNNQCRSVGGKKREEGGAVCRGATMEVDVGHDDEGAKGRRNIAEESTRNGVARTDVNGG